MERNIKLTIAYDGTSYHGFQRQANAMTVQQILEERLAKIFGHPLKIAGAARTDTGVHAFGQVATFVTAGTIPTDKIPIAAKGILPADIVVTAAEEAQAGFHARVSAKSKIYIYRAYADNIPDPFLRNFAWRLRYAVDVSAMDEAARLVIGEHDFSAFRAAGSTDVNPVRRILAAGCRQRGRLIEFEFWGTGFLYHMVRNLVGTLVDVGYKKLTREDFQTILEGKDRGRAGATAPPQGLYLKQIFY